MTKNGIKKLSLKQVLSALNKWGMTDNEIIKELGISRSALSDWNNYADLKPLGGYRKRVEQMAKKYLGSNVKVDW